MGMFRSPGRSKYGNKRTEVDGIAFDSKAEARRWGELKMLVAAGEIGSLERQAKYVLIPKQDGERECAYVADFTYWKITPGCRIVEDVKGYRTEVYRLKRKLMLYVFGIRVVEIGGTKQKKRTITPGHRPEKA